VKWLFEVGKPSRRS
jgi:hypothetical protein